MIPISQPTLAESAMAYLKAIGLVTALLVIWAGFCSI
jgi:hypothetical protein